MPWPTIPLGRFPGEAIYVGQWVSRGRQEFTAPVCVSKIHNTTDVRGLFALRKGQWTRKESMEALINVQTD